jgi:hypothetical protein
MKLTILTLFLLLSNPSNSAPAIITAVASYAGISIALATFYVAIGAMILAKLLTPKAEAGLLDKNPKALIKSSTEVRKYIYGEVVVGGTIVFKTKKKFYKRGDGLITKYGFASWSSFPSIFSILR